LRLKVIFFPKDPLEVDRLSLLVQLIGLLALGTAGFTALNAGFDLFHSSRQDVFFY
jgi:hypothetical protein